MALWIHHHCLLYGKSGCVPDCLEAGSSDSQSERSDQTVQDQVCPVWGIINQNLLWEDGKAGGEILRVSHFFHLTLHQILPDQSMEGSLTERWSGWGWEGHACRLGLPGVRQVYQNLGSDAGGTVCLQLRECSLPGQEIQPRQERWIRSSGSVHEFFPHDNFSGY